MVGGEAQKGNGNGTEGYHRRIFHLY
jgi:hypothetical protein